MMPSERIPEEEAMTDDVIEYDQLAGRYLDKVGYTWVRTLLSGFNLQQKSSVLDLGTGSGRLLSTVLDAFPFLEGVGIDVSETMLDVAKRHFQMGNRPNATVRLGNVRQLPFSDEQFDVVISFASMHHWQGPLAPVFLEANRVLKPGGVLVIGDLKRTEKNAMLLKWIPSPSFRKLAEASVRASYTPEEIRAVLATHPLLNRWTVVETPFAMAVVAQR